MPDQSNIEGSGPSKIDDKKRFEIEYKKVDDDIRHYSTTRSALTTFLLTVGLTALAASFSNEYSGHSWFFAVVGFVLFLASAVTCWEFSKRTQRSTLHLKQLWNWSHASDASDANSYPFWRGDKELKNLAKEAPTEPEKQKAVADLEKRRSSVRKKMRADPMNGLLLVIIAVITVAFVLAKFCPFSSCCR